MHATTLTCKPAQRTVSCRCDLELSEGGRYPGLYILTAHANPAVRALVGLALFSLLDCVISQSIPDVGLLARGTLSFRGSMSGHLDRQAGMYLDRWRRTSSVWDPLPLPQTWSR